MRTRALFGLSFLVLILAAAIGLPAPVHAVAPFCLIADQQCVSCGWGCEQLCTYYECDDGSSYVICGGCSCIQQCVVP
jgi:hypothetical protein